MLVKDTTDIVILSKCILLHHDIAEKLLMWNNIAHLQTHPSFHQPTHSCLRSYTSSLDKLQNMTFLLYINYTLAKKEFSIFCLFLLCVRCRHSPIKFLISEKKKIFIISYGPMLQKNVQLCLEMETILNFQLKQ
jgi:hypothetical protein